ncbi:ROK family protein [Bacillus sp. N9]
MEMIAVTKRRWDIKFRNYLPQTASLMQKFLKPRCLLSGTNNILGEIGHTVMEPNGLLCDCGRRDCFQTFI